MDVLAAWLKQIILVVLLATFADLLLPNRSMQRYVKLVISLFVLVTILSPIMSLLGSGTNLRMLAASVDGWSLGGTLDDAYLKDAAPEENYPQSGAMPTLSRVLSDAESLADKRNTESLKLLEAKMESMVKEQIESQHGVAVKQADVRLSLTQDGGPKVEYLDIVIGLDRMSTGDGSGEQTEGVPPVKPIEPIDIRVQVGEEPLPALLPQPKLSKEAEAKRREVAESLSKQWEVERRRVTVTVESSSGT